MCCVLLQLTWYLGLWYSTLRRASPKRSVVVPGANPNHLTRSTFIVAQPAALTRLILAGLVV